MGTGRNGGIIGTANLPTSESASGVWTMNEVRDAVEQSIWPGAGLEASQTGSDSDGTTQSTYTFSGVSIGAADANRYVVVGLALRAAGNRTISSVTIGGVTATSAVDLDGDAGGNTTRAALFIAAVPTGTTADVVMTLSGSAARAAVVAWRLVNANPTANDTDTSSSDPSGSTLNIPAGGVGIGFGASHNGTSVSWTNLVEDVDSVESGMVYSGAHNTYMAEQTGLDVEANFVSASNQVTVHASWGA